MKEDRELLAAWRGGDREAGSLLLSSHLPMLRRFFDARLPASAEDLIQQTLISFLRDGDPCTPTSSVRAYLLAVARSRLFDHLRESRRNHEDPASVPVVVDPNTTPTERVRQNEVSAIVRECMRCLPELLRIPLELHYWEGFSMEEIADVLDVPVGTAKSRLRLARTRFSRHFRARCGHGPDGTEPFRP